MARTLHVPLGLLLGCWLLFGGGSLRLGLAKEPVASTASRVERWYERRLRGQKAGHLHVVWSPSTWQGKPTIRDRTVSVSISTRSMAGMRDRFETTTLIELERAPDGRLWWHRLQQEEAGRTLVETLTWTGKGYEVERVLGDETEAYHIPLAAPVATDAESLAGPLLAQGALTVGGEPRHYDMLDLRARSRARYALRLVETLEAKPGDHGEGTQRYHLVDSHVASGSETHLWMDEAGGLVRLATEGGVEIIRADRKQAEAAGEATAEYDITVSADPRLERVFAADRLTVDVHLQPDATRRVPEFPKSPWGHELERAGDDATGWRLRLALKRHAGKGLTATLPIEGEEHARDLASTVLMPAAHKQVQQVAKGIIGDLRDARQAATRLSRWVFENLRKQSPRVAQASALQILDEMRGDCSEHALLYVTLCRAVGIPARRCSGYVCVGSLWGSHAWAEVFVGEWVGADPTTGEFEPGARYLFFGYPDVEGSFPGLVSSRVSGRMRLVTRLVEEGAASFDLLDPKSHRRYDPEGRRFLHVLCGLEAREVPEDWEVTLTGSSSMTVRAPTWRARLVAMADQGMRRDQLLRHLRDTMLSTTFGEAPALMYGGKRVMSFIVYSRGRTVRVNLRATGDADLAPADVVALEQALRPTFVEPALAWE